VNRRLSHRVAISLVATLAILAYGLAIDRLSGAVRDPVQPELLVSLPRFAQVLLAGGARHLAANLAGFRVLVAETSRMSAADYAVQARLQSDVAWFNPLHEDNYYIAATILPWNGHVDAAQDIMRQASRARTFDWYPLFQYGFIVYHFRRDPATAARFLVEAVPRVESVRDQWALQNVAALWIEKGYESGAAAGMVEAMAAASPSGNFRRYLEARAKRLRDLEMLQSAAAVYRERFGKGIVKLDDLVDAELLPAIPRDPLGLGFGIDSSGSPTLNTHAEPEER